MNVILAILLLILVIYASVYFSSVIFNEYKSRLPFDETPIFKENEDTLTFYEQLEEKVLALLVKDPKGKMLKSAIMKGLYISPYQLKSCIKQLIDKELIISSEKSIELTRFGRYYYNGFLKPIDGIEY